MYMNLIMDIFDAISLVEDDGCKYCKDRKGDVCKKCGAAYLPIGGTNMSVYIGDRPL